MFNKINSIKIIKKTSVILGVLLVSFIFSSHILTYSSNEELTFIINRFFEIDKALNLDKTIEDMSSIAEGENLLKELNNKYEFEKQWRDKLQYSILTYEYILHVDIKEIKDSRAKVYVERDLEFTMTTSPKTSQKSQNERFIFILKNTGNNWKIIDYCYEEENPDYFYTLINNPLGSDHKNPYSTWEENLNNIEELFAEFKSLGNNSCILNSYENISYNIDREKIKEYAEEFALLRNPMFMDFEKYGGDCTNFISQALSYGGLMHTETWKPYTYPWIRVNDLRDYLVYNGLAKEYPQIGSQFLGDIVQFSSTAYDTWSHSIILTYKLPNNDYLYCCHSYDKLNYPLSKSYPVIYPKIRVLDLN